jgi:predicted transcriptional regulator YdeE
MQKPIPIVKQEIMLVGIKTRTNNRDESSFEKGKIFPCVQRYFHQRLFDAILNRKNPGTTFCAYTDYESDHTGDYTYFIGEEVNSLTNVPAGMESLKIPPQHYAKFTAGPGSMPSVLTEAWQEIWELSDTNLGGKRRYGIDFEIYDERALDHNKIIFDIYIGLQS